MRFRRTANFSTSHPAVQLKTSVIALLTLVALPAGTLLGQDQPSAREGISNLENMVAAQLAKSLAAPAAAHRVMVSSRDGKSKLIGTLADPQKGWVVTSGDYAVNGAKTALISISGKAIQTGKILGYSKDDHLLLIQIAAAPEAPALSIGEIEAGSFVGGFSHKGVLKSGVVTSRVRAENKVFAPHEQKALIGHWQRLGLKVSERRSQFAAVFETDLDLDADDCGGPIFSSHGNLIGVVISRAGHHATLVVPVSRIAKLFGGN